MDDDLREAIARVIAPFAGWTLLPIRDDAKDATRRRQTTALAKADAIMSLPALAAKDARIRELTEALDPNRLGELIRQATGALGGAREFRPLPEIPGATHSVAVSLPDASPVIDCVKLARLLASPARSTLHSQGEGG